MKILLEATVLQEPFTGVARSTLNLYAHCVALRPSLAITAIHPKTFSQPVPNYLQSKKLSFWGSPRLWKHVVVPFQCARSNADAIHFPWNGNVPRLFSKTPVITTIHDVLPLTIPNYFSTPEALQKYRNKIQHDLNRSHLVITPSQYSKDEISRNFEVRSEPVVIHWGPAIRINSHAGEADVDRLGSFFVYTGGYAPRKGLVPLLRTFIELHKKKRCSSTLVLTSEKKFISSEFSCLLDEAYRLNIVKEFGYVSDEMLASLFSRAKALIYPSQYEGFGLPPLEAMSVGCPVITTRGTSIPEICGDAGFYVDPNDVKSFSETIIMLEQDEYLRDQFKIKGLKQAAKFSWEKAADTFIKSVDETIKRGA